MTKIVLKGWKSLVIERSMKKDSDGDWIDHCEINGTVYLMSHMKPWFNGRTIHEATAFSNGSYRLHGELILPSWVKQPALRPRSSFAKQETPKETEPETKKETTMSITSRAKETTTKAVHNTKTLQIGRVSIATAKAAVTKMKVLPAIAKPFYGGVSGDIATALAIYVAIDILKKDHPLADTIKEGVATHALNELANRVPVEEFLEGLLASIEGKVALEGMLPAGTFDEDK